MNPFVRTLSNLMSKHDKSGSPPASTPTIGSRSRRRTARSRSTRLVAGASALLLPVAIGLPTITASAAPVGQGFNLNGPDLRFVLKQIKISEQHARTRTPADPCGTLLGAGVDQIPNTGGQGALLPMGLRTVDGSCNNLVPGQSDFATADKTFPRLAPAQFRSAENVPTGFGPPATTSYTQTKGNVFDAQPRIISNLIVDQTAKNPAAIDSAGPGEFPCTTTGVPVGCTPTGKALFIPNVAPDTGLSSPYNSWFTMFGQFFDHGLDLTSKSGGSVFMPLQPGDPLFSTAPGAPNFMLLTRSTNQPGPDGVTGDVTPTTNPLTRCVTRNNPANCDESIDDVKNATNQTSPFVDQSQTYTSHPSHQVFLRQYANNALGKPVSTGKLIEVDGGMATWTTVKEEARTKLGINLADADVLNVPMLATDPYGRFTRGLNGYPQLVVPGAAGGLREGNPAAPISTTGATKTGHAFLDDIAHNAAPKPGLTADVNTTITGANGAQDAGTYDNEMLNAHFIAGDGRVNENIALTAVHHVFHSEHNRLSADSTVNGSIKNVITTEDPTQLSQWQLSPGVWNGERIFQAARFVTEMQYQHLAFEEFARKVQPQVNLFAGYDTSINPAISAEFAHAVYRFGHSMLNETVARTSVAGVPSDIPLLDAFLNPPSFRGGTLTPNQAAGNIVRGLTEQRGNELDEFVTEALRNQLLGLPLDLASLNLARAREAGVPSLNAVRRTFFAQTQGNAALAPYANWNDFGLALKHRSSLINFVAAYGKHPTITGTVANKRTAAARLVAADPLDLATPSDSVAFMEGTGATWSNALGVTTTGLDTVDLWIGGLAEKQQPFGGLLGSTFNFVFETQMERLQDGDRLYYLSRTAGLNMLVQLEGNSFAELIGRNTDAANLPADTFSKLDYHFHLAAQNATGVIVNDPATPYDETALLTRMADNTIRFDGPEHVAFHGKSAASPTGDDKVWSSEGDDTLRGNDGNDRLEGGAGNDSIIGGLGDDIMTDLFGDDVSKGGDGNDAISSGQGFDLNQPGRGNDFVVSGSDPTETFGGSGNDFVFGGDSFDTVFGDDGDDWIEGGGQADLLQGDNGAPFQDDANTPGHDVIDGGGGADDYDAEGGDDVMVSGPGIERNEGMLGFDWVTHEGDPQAGDSDLSFTGLLPPTLDALRDRFDMVEGLSGYNLNDVLRGDDVVAADMVGHSLTPAGITRVTGLSSVVGSTTSFTGGNVILGGAGTDILEGRGGNDILDGDKYLAVSISVRNAANAEIQKAQSMSEVRAGVFAGTINPGRLQITREILTGAGGTDTAVFRGLAADYVCTVAGQLPGPCAGTSTGLTTVVAHRDADGVVGAGVDGTDTIRNIERLVFQNTVAPGTPAIGTATAGNGTATANWNPSPTGIPTGFSVRVINDATGGQIALLTAAANATSLTVPVANGTRVRFQVQAFNAVLPRTAFSLPSNVVTPAAPPGAPTIGVATAGQVVGTLANQGTAVARWTAPASNGGSVLTGYSVRVANAATNAQIGALRPASAGTTSLTVTGLVGGTAVRFQVQARNAAATGAFSALSTTAVTPRTVSSPPGIAPANPGTVGGAITATANWTPPAATANGGSVTTGYVVTALQGGVVRQTSAVLTAGFRSLVMTLPAGNYQFVVQARSAMGSSARSTASNVVTAR